MSGSSHTEQCHFHVCLCLCAALNIADITWHQRPQTCSHQFLKYSSSLLHLFAAAVLWSKQGCCSEQRWRRVNVQPALACGPTFHISYGVSHVSFYRLSLHIFMCVCNNTPHVYYCLGSSAASCLLLSPRNFICPVTGCIICVFLCKSSCVWVLTQYWFPASSLFHC